MLHARESQVKALGLSIFAGLIMAGCATGAPSDTRVDFRTIDSDGGPPLPDFENFDRAAIEAILA